MTEEEKSEEVTKEVEAFEEEVTAETAEVTEKAAETTDAKLAEPEGEGLLKESKQFFKQETYTNGQEITIDVLTPIKIPNSGKISVDKNKPKIFVGKAPVDVGDRIIPFTFMIDGVSNFKEALDVFDESCKNSLAEANQKRQEQMEELKNERSNQIVVPGASQTKSIIED